MRTTKSRFMMGLKSIAKRKYFLTLLAALAFASPHAQAATIPPNRVVPVILQAGSPDGTNLTVNPGGTLIVPSAGLVPAVLMDGGTSINNSGLIELTGNAILPPAALISNTLLLTTTAPISITNNAGGVMQWVDGVGNPQFLIDFRGNASYINISNAGTFTGAGIATGLIGSNASLLNLTNTGTINNANRISNINGDLVITNSGTMNLDGNVFASGNFTLINSGSFDRTNTAILGAGLVNSITINPIGNASIVNTGTVGFFTPVDIAPTGALYLANSGILGSAANTVVIIPGGADAIPSTLINTESGSITGAINFGGLLMPSSLTNRGIIIGNTTLGGNVNAPSVFTIGGPQASVQGNILGNNNAINNQVIFDSNFTYANTISNVSSVNVQGGTFNLLSMGNIQNFNSFSTNTGAVANIAGTLTSSNTGVITNFGTLNINAPVVTAMGGLTNNGTMNVNVRTLINGRVYNNGLLNLNNLLQVVPATTLYNNGVVAVALPQTLVGDYVQSANGTFMPIIASPTVYGSLTIIGNSAFSAGTNVLVSVLDGSGVGDGNVFDVVFSQNSLPAASAFLVTSSAPLLAFTPTIVGPNGNILRLTSRSLAFGGDNSGLSPNAQVMARVFDRIRAQPHDPRFNPIFAILDGLSAEDREIAFDSLAPDPYEGSSIPSYAAIDAWTKKITASIDMKRQASLGNKMGYMAGDFLIPTDSAASISPVFFTNGQRQKDRNGVHGYKATTNGIGILGDFCINEFWRIGAGFGYAHTHVKAGRFRGKKSGIDGYFGTVFASYNDGPAFADGLFNLGSNRYHDRQHITIGPINTLSRAEYNGTQSSAKFRVGYGMPFWCFEVAPVATYYYAKLDREDYFQRHSGVLNMYFPAKGGYRSQGGLGLRFAYLEMEDCFVPEFHAIFQRDFNRPGIATTGQFIAGGPAFTVRAPRQYRNSANLGVSLTAMLTPDIMVLGSYDLETTRRFHSNSGTLKFRWLF